MIAVKSGRNTSHLLIKLECMVKTATDLTAIIAECALQYAPPCNQNLASARTCHVTQATSTSPAAMST